MNKYRILEVEYDDFNHDLDNEKEEELNLVT